MGLLTLMNPDELEPRMSFFYLQQLHGGQDADILKDAFKKNEMTDAIQKIAFFGSDGTNTNSGLKTALITKLKDDISWIQSIRCVSHRLKLSMKDALKEFMKPVDDSLVHLYYLFKKSSKKLSQLKSLSKDLESVYDFESKSIKPEKSSGTSWLDHKIRAMKKLIDKLGVYAKQIECSIEKAAKSKDKATLQGKLTAMKSSDVLLRRAFLSDILEPAKIISLVSQKESSDIIATADYIKRGKETYQRWFKKFTASPEKVFELPNIKSVLDKLDEENLTFQGVRITWAPSVIQNIFSCIDKRFGKLDGSSDDVTAEAKEGDDTLFHICRVLNCNVFPLEADEESLALQIESLSFIFQKFKDHPLLTDFSLCEITDGFIDIVLYMIKYFPVTSMNRKEFRKNVLRLGKSEGMVDQWRRALMIIEICLIAPHSNAALERFFSILKLVKTLIRSRLDSDILNALMRIKMSCPSLEDFSHEHCKACVDKWYASKNRRINQKKTQKT